MLNNLQNFTQTIFPSFYVLLDTSISFVKLLKPFISKLTIKVFLFFSYIASIMYHHESWPFGAFKTMKTDERLEIIGNLEIQHIRM